MVKSKTKENVKIIDVGLFIIELHHLHIIVFPNQLKIPVSKDYNARFTIVLAGLTHFALGQRDPEDMYTLKEIGQNFPNT